MRDPRKLKVFCIADALTLDVYRITRTFPREEVFGLTAQLRRSAISVPSNIVEGCARDTEGDYLRFLDTAYGSAKEMEYQLSLARRLGYLPDTEEVLGRVEEVCRALNALIRSLRRIRNTSK